MEEDSAQQIAEKILQLITLKGKRVLEVGCGYGRVTALLAAIPEQLIAIDPNVQSIMEARCNGSSADFRVGSGEALPFPDHFFDTVLFTLSLHHQDSAAALRDAERVLRDNGTIVVVEPTVGGEVGELFGLLHDESEDLLTAQAAITASSLARIGCHSFCAYWSFDNAQELYQVLFDYFGLPYDRDKALRMSDLLGPKSGASPIILNDTMTIQSFKKSCMV